MVQTTCVLSDLPLYMPTIHAYPSPNQIPRRVVEQ